MAARRGAVRSLTGGTSPRLIRARGQVAQSVEQRTENPRVDGSIPSLATTRSGFPCTRECCPSALRRAWAPLIAQSRFRPRAAVVRAPRGSASRLDPAHEARGDLPPHSRTAGRFEPHMNAPDDNLPRHKDDFGRGYDLEDPGPCFNALRPSGYRMPEVLAGALKAIHRSVCVAREARSGCRQSPDRTDARKLRLSGIPGEFPGNRADSGRRGTGT